MKRSPYQAAGQGIVPRPSLEYFSVSDDSTTRRTQFPIHRQRQCLRLQIKPRCRIVSSAPPTEKGSDSPVYPQILSKLLRIPTFPPSPVWFPPKGSPFPRSPPILPRVLPAPRPLLWSLLQTIPHCSPALWVARAVALMWVPASGSVWVPASGLVPQPSRPFSSSCRRQNQPHVRYKNLLQPA